MHMTQKATTRFQVVQHLKNQKDKSRPSARYIFHNVSNLHHGRTIFNIKLATESGAGKINRKE